MIQTLSVSRFKSIRALSIPCRKVNIFIGAPDTGKTNMLEALYLLSSLGWGRPLNLALRLRQDLGFEPLFYRQFLDPPLQVSMRLDAPLPKYNITELTAKVRIGGPDRRLEIQFPEYGWDVRLGFGESAELPQLQWIRWYSYGSSDQWTYNANPPHGAEIVYPPHGDNLVYIARHKPRVYDFLKDLVAGLNWKLKFDQTQRIFRLSEVREDEILDYNLELLSDSLKRLFFYSAILLTSENATLVLDEPDVFAFPPYPKTLGEMIASDASNQFFLTTHNPYFLAGLVEKTPADRLALFVCYRDPEGATTVKLLRPEDVARVIEFGPSVFFNLDQFLDQ